MGLLVLTNLIMSKHHMEWEFSLRPLSTLHCKDHAWMCNCRLVMTLSGLLFCPVSSHLMIYVFSHSLSLSFSLILASTIAQHLQPWSKPGSSIKWQCTITTWLGAPVKTWPALTASYWWLREDTRQGMDRPSLCNHWDRGVEIETAARGRDWWKGKNKKQNIMTCPDHEPLECVLSSSSIIQRVCDTKVIDLPVQSFPDPSRLPRYIHGRGHSTPPATRRPPADTVEV